LRKQNDDDDDDDDITCITINEYEKLILNRRKHSKHNYQNTCYNRNSWSKNNNNIVDQNCNYAHLIQAD